MRLLIVCSANAGQISPFVADQAEHLQRQGLVLEIFAIKGKGIRGYLSNLPALKKKIRAFKPDLVHAHSGMSALLASLQRIRPVVVTFHGTDINNARLRRFSRLAMLLSARQMVVSKHMATLLGKPEMTVIPCGVDTHLFSPVKREDAANDLKLDKDKIHLLFASSFSNTLKNYPLAKAAIEQCNDVRIQLHPLEKIDRQTVARMINACHACLMTSISEGSPQFIKEALACGTPIITTDVGDVSETIGQTSGCFVCPPEPAQLAIAIKQAISFSEESGKTNGPSQIQQAGLDAENISRRLISFYNKVLEKNAK
ncbi:MAG: glycosyltransferase [Bacteroidia bacterium]|jgi:teichuronic acid biosynthesis glycosyltransferase TuaC|nr:glycosyltransferase [Bacteroidia bacterium]MCC6767792.1 glycosyltransferase [Bacteroidia bacterium]